MRIELDTVINEDAGESIEQLSQDLTRIYGLQVSLVNAHGPAGGNSILALESDPSDVELAVRGVWGDDAWEAANGR